MDKNKFLEQLLAEVKLCKRKHLKDIKVCRIVQLKDRKVLEASIENDTEINYFYIGHDFFGSMRDYSRIDFYDNDNYELDWVKTRSIAINQNIGRVPLLTDIIIGSHSSHIKKKYKYLNQVVSTICRLTKEPTEIERYINSHDNGYFYCVGNVVCIGDDITLHISIPESQIYGFYLKIIKSGCKIENEYKLINPKNDKEFSSLLEEVLTILKEALIIDDDKDVVKNSVVELKSMYDLNKRIIKISKNIEVPNISKISFSNLVNLVHKTKDEIVYIEETAYLTLVEIKNTKNAQLEAILKDNIIQLNEVLTNTKKFLLQLTEEYKIKASIEMNDVLKTRTYFKKESRRIDIPVVKAKAT